ncbi:RecF/RecN/SMC protein [Cutaneotrichosporon oleaginosum]|uniref:Structural maintenance of chromosomes protein n=1 Tax=Cutaneotrichosporon oleaginosum TaxID=879819 RepID=A0A0J0XRC2_9TREE|nr:RecF/RecN/SMC protein [Cutaneotrichosporon oleaginosum]KLT43612.1 RecF/RecN/SMC protein [Cutaneotrichosporon oleaginosum]TXT12720.1 hypothetical protein COLE_03130 [Cutaneotrichosporon oleaginosum]
MPLRRLELSNFKSYRGAQVIDFGDDPFTCIIGPNGSGKSNLMDAISFVLGIKSQQLRSTKLADLVYRGRKAAEGAQELGLDVDVPETQESPSQLGPNDARNASVAIVFQDDNGREWNFRRTMSASAAGSSSYSLNGKTVRWEEYNKQLEKFNILVKAKNFLVFQGDVENVASQDAKKLSELIDRISGSADYADAYEDAKLQQEKASEAANANHAKKRSMLTEAKHFKEQTAEVKQWEKLMSSKDAMIQRHLLWRLYHITNEINDSTRRVEEASEQLAELRGTVDDKSNDLKEARKAYAAAQLKVKSREGSVKKAVKALDDKKPELVKVETEIEHSEKKVKSTALLVERVEKDQKRQAESVAALKAGGAEIRRKMEEARAKQREKSQAAGRALTDADLAEYRRLRAEANLLVVDERQQLEALRREQKSLVSALASMDDQVQQAERKRSRLTTDVEALAEREETMAEKVAEMEGEAKRIKSQLDQAQAERNSISMRETELNDRLQETLRKLVEAGADKRESERETRTKENIATLRRLFPGIHGRVIELCKPTANKYETAVRTVLGRSLDQVVVETERVAIECIEYLKQQRKGVLTFVPLDTVQVKAVPDKLRNVARGARLAIDCVEFDPSVERAMQYACGSAIICDTQEIAKFVCYEKRMEVKAVTLDGTVFHKAGLITGGRGQGGNGRKFNDKDVESLKQLKEKQLKQLQELSQSKPKEKDDEGKYKALSRLQAELGSANDDLSATRLRLDGMRKELAAVEKDLKKLKPEREKRAKALHDAESRLEGLAQTVDAADDSIFAAFCQRINVDNIREYEDVQLKVAREENEALEEFKTKAARNVHAVEFEEQQLKATEDRLASLQATLERELRNSEARSKRKQQVEEEIEALQAEIERQEAKLEKAKNAAESVAEEVEAARSALKSAQRDLDTALKEIASWNDEIVRSASDRHAIYRRCRLEDIDLPLNRGSLNKVPIDESTNDMAMDVDDGSLHPARTDDYGIEPDFDPLTDEDRENDTPEYGAELEAQIAKMKADLERVIPNMKAVDRLKDVQNDLELAEDEAEDARRASKEARERFLGLKKKRCELFNKAYQHMSGCIDRIYKDLTKQANGQGGGMAFLSLEDSEEPYLAGVKYNTMPPGKRFVEIEQLSGGEKTMAALALLFSIHSFHPAPFFVLDEVDAALDPTNVSKLARYVRQQAEKKVQFLIISLKSTL